MNTQRITVSIPDYIYRQLLNRAQPRGVSKLVVEALEKRLMEEKISKRKDPVNEFFELGKKLPKRNIGEILAAIHKGRT